MTAKKASEPSPNVVEPSQTAEPAPVEPPQSYPWADTPTRIANLEFNLAKLEENAKTELRKIISDLHGLNHRFEEFMLAAEERFAKVEAAAKVEPPKPPLWRRPSPTQVNPAWCLAPGTEFTATKSIGQQDVSNLTEFELRAQFGYLPDGSRALAGPELENAYLMCERLAKATNDEEADAVVMGAGTVPFDVAIARILLGLTAGGKFGTTPLMSALKHYPEKSMAELLKGLTT